MSAPPVTVVICAYTEKRWRDLAAAVASVQAQQHPAAQIVLVIDHNDALLGRCRQQLPEISLHPNRHAPGLSGARNTAIDAATGDVLAFLDDDATAGSGWLQRLLPHYADPDVCGVGGSAHPVWPDRRPATLPAPPGQPHGELDWVIGCTYHGQPEQPTDVRNLMGCNMSFRREVFTTVGGFAEHLGRIGRTPLGCEETELCIRLRQHTPGARIVFEPAARVQHRVSPDRLTWRYLAARGWAEGTSKAAVSRLVGPGDALATERNYVTTVLPRAIVRELRAGLRGPAHLASASAIGAALSCTSAGYVRGRIIHRPYGELP